MAHPLHRINKRHVQNIVPYLLIAILFGMIGYAIGQNKPVAVNKPTSTMRVAADALIKSQQAVAVGKITKVANDWLTVLGDDGSSQDFKLSPQLNIYITPVASSSAGKPSNNKADIQLNKKAIINLTYQGDSYKVGTITYLP